MADNDIFKRYLDAGIQFTQMTQKRAEAIAKDLVKAGEVQADNAQDFVQDLLERSRKNSEKMVKDVRKEVRGQIESRRLATKADVARLEKKVAALEKKTAAPKKAAAKKKAPAKKTTAKKKA